MKRKKITALCISVAMMSTMVVGGCSLIKGKNYVEWNEGTITGTVQSVEDDTITLALSQSQNQGGQMPENGQGQSQPGGMQGGPGGDNSTGGQSAPGGNAGGQNTQGGTPPQMPEGNNNSGSDSKTASGEGVQGGSAGGQNTQGGTPPQMPGGDNNSDNSDKKDTSSGTESTVKLVIKDESVIKDSDNKSADLDDIEEGDSLTVTIDEDGKITAVQIGSTNSENGQPQGAETASAVTDYDAVKKLGEDTSIQDEKIASTGTDENAILVTDGAEVSVDGTTITRTSSDSTGGDQASFYGVGAAVLATNGTATIKNSKITTDAKGGAGVFAYGDGIARVSDTTIRTTQDTSGGVHVAGGGKLYASNLDVETEGESSAAIRSDRGGGTMVVDGGTYTSKGTGSPAVYCTADITVKDADLQAENSEGVCIEGKNALRLFDCDLTSNMPENEQNDCQWSLIVYQSMSGDSEVGNGDLQIVGGSITSKSGGLLYTTNTQSNILLSDVDITMSDADAYFLQCTGNNNARGWGSSQNNGAQCTFTANEQKMNGNVIYDSISTLDFYMQNNSVLTGAFVDDETYAGDGGDGTCEVSIDKTSTWIVTADSKVTSLNCEGTIQDADGNVVTIVGEDGTVYVQGSSAYTITTGSYATTADFSKAAAVPAYEDYASELSE